MPRITHESCWCVWEFEMKSNSTKDEDVFQKVVLLSDEEIWRNTTKEHNFTSEEEARAFFHSKEVAPHHSYTSELSLHSIYVYNGLVFAYTEWGTFLDGNKIAYNNTTIIDCFVNTADIDCSCGGQDSETEQTDTDNSENKKQGE